MTGRTSEVKIHNADEGHRNTVLDILLDALADDPLAIWMFPDPGDRRQLQAQLHRDVLSHPGADVDLTAPRGGAAIWLRMDGEPPTASSSEHSSHDRAAQNPADRIDTVGRTLARFHPDGPHRYLWCMGVTPARQGGGLGSSMLRHRTARADRDGERLYLEASSPRSRSLYLAHGFEDFAGPVRVEGSPPLWPMSRNPR